MPISHTAAKPYSVDANLWGRSIEAGGLEDPWDHLRQAYAERAAQFLSTALPGLDPAKLRHPRNEGLLVSLAGPAVNLSLAAASAV